MYPDANLDAKWSSWWWSPWRRSSCEVDTVSWSGKRKSKQVFAKWQGILLVTGTLVAGGWLTSYASRRASFPVGSFFVCVLWFRKTWSEVLSESCSHEWARSAIWLFLVVSRISSFEIIPFLSHACCPNLTAKLIQTLGRDDDCLVSIWYCTHLVFHCAW